MTTATDVNRESKAINDHEIEWQLEEAKKTNLPEGIMVKVFNEDPVMKRQDLKVKFPAGYVEPAHKHKNWHSLVVLKGRMCVDGKDLRPGDYFFGFDTVHGPLEYPDGCEVFVVTMGDSIEHEWDEDDHAAHERKWDAETDEGKQAISEKTKE